MIFNETGLQGSFLITLQPRGDERGWFARTFCKQEFSKIGHHKEWVQMNHSFTADKGTVRGMHFQFAPHREIKLVRCIAGAVFDVIVDLRQDSATFLQSFGAELTAENKKMMYVPEGFAHGFQTLCDNTELIYQHTDYYEPASEGGLNPLDPRLSIAWPLDVTVMSERDKGHTIITESFKGI